MTFTPIKPAPGTTESDRPFHACNEATEDSVALQFVEQHAGRLRYVNTVGKWYVWTGLLWQVDEQRRVFHLAREACRSFGDQKAALLKSASAAGVERYAKADPRLSATIDQFDQNPMLLGTPGGTVDLTTGGLLVANPNDLISKSTSVVPGVGPAARWLKFLYEACGGDPAFVRYLQRWCGYALTGDIRHHQMAFFFGPGGNGKSVFMNTRLVCASETNEDRALDEARIKQLTGGDQITARLMRQNNFTYAPQFKLFFTGNHAPRLHNVDDAMRRRLAIIPFLHKPLVPDRELEAKLMAELPQIFSWAIEGCLDCQREGLVRPKAVAEATERYFDEQDSTAQWLVECCDTGPEHYESASKLFTSWSKFAKAAGDPPGAQRALASVLVKRGFQPVKMSGGARYYRGLSIKPGDGVGSFDGQS
jgi:putative DNA primase/helicase